MTRDGRRFDRAAIVRRRLSRRALLRGVGGGGLLVSVAGCGGQADDGEATPSPTAVPSPTQGPIASPVAGYPDPTKWAGRTVSVASQGGEYQDAQVVALFEPFAAATGAQIQEKAFDLGELREQVDRDAVAWDLVHVPTEEVLPLARGRYLTPIDYQQVDRSSLDDDIAMQHGVGAAFFSTVIAFPIGGERPQGWTDFWDVKRFPGARTLRRRPVGTLEFALLADGVPMAELYPLDVERAFAALDRIRPDVAQWTDNNTQPIQLLLNGDVAMASTYHVGGVTEEARTEVELEWRGGMLSADSWVIPRDAPNADVAMDLINFATRAVPCANFSRLVAFGPVNRDALPLLRPDRLPLLPTAEPQRSVQFVENWNWWADNREALTERFEEWLLEAPVPVLSEGTPGGG